VPLAAAPTTTQVARVLTTLERGAWAEERPDAVRLKELAVAAKNAARRLAAALGLSMDAESSSRCETPPL
jgi:hypothetical protein